MKKLFYLLWYFFNFYFIFISWRLITLQYCSGFCHTLTWISHGFTCIPHPDPPLPPPSPPDPSGSSQCTRSKHLSHAYYDTFIFKSKSGTDKSKKVKVYKEYTHNLYVLPSVLPQNTTHVIKLKDDLQTFLSFHTNIYRIYFIFIAYSM